MIPSNWTVGTELLRHTLGAVSRTSGVTYYHLLHICLAQALIGLHVWAVTESLEVLGVFGTRLSTSLSISTADILCRLKGGFTAISLLRISQLISNTREYIGKRCLVAIIFWAVPTPAQRYLNDPDVMNGAGYLGLSFISGNKLVIIVTVIKHLAQWWFLRNVER